MNPEDVKPGTLAFVNDDPVLRLPDGRGWWIINNLPLDTTAAWAWLDTLRGRSLNAPRLAELTQVECEQLAAAGPGQVHEVVARIEAARIASRTPFEPEASFEDVVQGYRWMGVTARPRSPGMEALIGVRTPVLDHGFLEVLDYMGTDADVVLSARTTSGTTAELTADAKDRQPSDDVKLLRYMMRHRHTSPFEMCELRVLVQAPIFVERQWVRHRTANWNGHSLRYGPPLGVFYKPAPEHVAAQSVSNRQGRSVRLEGAALDAALDILQHDSVDEPRKCYERLADELGVARELARAVLPVSLYTRWVWKIDAHNLMHFLGLRLDPHAQLEIRAYAEVLARIVAAWLPETWRAFEDYRLHAITLTRAEVVAVGKFIEHLQVEHGIETGRVRDYLELYAGVGGRELDEGVAKLQRMLKAAQEWGNVD